MHRHRTDVISLVFGLLFVAAGAAVLARALPSPTARVWEAWPAVLILLGAWVLVATARGRRRDDAATEPAAAARAGDAEAGQPRAGDGEPDDVPRAGDAEARADEDTRDLAEQHRPSDADR